MLNDYTLENVIKKCIHGSECLKKMQKYFENEKRELVLVTVYPYLFSGSI